MNHAVYHAPYACHPDATRGRQHDEGESKTRTPYQRDRDRILHCGAFRRLKHKTQVFVAHVGDYYRTRLTHSLEVAQIGRSIARELGLDEELTETLSLAHDLGHTAFGHAGEDALDAAMQPFGGFDHNAQTLRIVTKLEKRYIPFDGLNMTWETLEGLVKHNGPLLAKGDSIDGLPFALREHANVQDLQLESWPSLEAQVAALSDDIAYNNHDIDDSIRAGLITLDDLRQLPLTGDILADIDKTHGKIDEKLVRHELVREMISVMIADLVGVVRDGLEKDKVETADDVRQMGRALAVFSPQMEAKHREIKAFLYERVYRHHTVNGSMSKARRIMRDLFDLYLAEPEVLTEEWRGAALSGDETMKARIICDYMAGMTDRFAMEEHRRLFDISDTMI
jgi:dGTPase